ncbi:MAG: endonuclease/exonuclease/phosphatase family protein [Desulfobacterales bacterium]|nr:MAG: endonuclease/exonuclease/phosphatase family protein [Desulfobacterales bacterium]
MRFLLYNIRYGAGVGKRVHLPVPYSGFLKNTNGNLRHIVEFIKSMHPDIIALIEVDSGSYRSEKNNQAEAIARAMKHYHVYQSKYPIDSIVQKIPLVNKQGNALLTNQIVKCCRFHYFSVGMKRLVIELELDKISIFLVHLSLKFRHRQYQLQELFSMVENVEKPVIVSGDFNVFWGDRELQLFAKASGLKTANDKGQPSHPSRSPRRQLDYIFHSPEIRVTRFQIPQIKFSDHVPLVCDFEIATAI